MFDKIILTGLVAACLVCGQNAMASPSNEETRAPKREAADTRLGVATMSAVMTGFGDIVRGTGTTLATRLSEGTYEVRFERDIRDCAYAATVGSSGAGQPGAATAVVAWRANVPEGLWIRIFNPSGSVASRDFHVIVFCGY